MSASLEALASLHLAEQMVVALADREGFGSLPAVRIGTGWAIAASAVGITVDAATAF